MKIYQGLCHASITHHRSKNDHTLIKLDAAHSFDQAHTMHYESTHQGQDDQKRRRQKLDNL